MPEQAYATNYAELTDIRADDPASVARAWSARVTRPTVRGDGRPTLLLGGDPTDPDATFASWAKALALPSVRGLVVGRSLLYPADDNVSAAVQTAVSLVR